ncbi:hypothetical protein ACTA71_005090 [Dictyostelium dimigraforme]
MFQRITFKINQFDSNSSTTTITNSTTTTTTTKSTTTTITRINQKIIKDKYKGILIIELPIEFEPPERPQCDMQVKLFPNCKPVKISYGKRSPGEMIKLIEKKDELKHGIIQPSTSAYQTAAFLAKDERFFLKYREV